MKLSVTRGLCFVLLIVAFGATSVYAQHSVSGTVTDADTGEPLPGVNISIRGTTTGTTTALDGTYTITVPGSDAALIFSFIGFQRREVPVDGRDVIDVALSEDVVGLEDVVVVGYGTQRREDVTGSVATIDADEANQGLITSPDQMLQGRAAGVSVTSNNGEPGSGFVVRVRGGTSISASNEPLYVIDGVPIDNSSVTPGGVGIDGDAPPNRNPLTMLNPNDIESINVLKGASATAIYGSRGANGVVLISTKSGQPGETTLSYEGYASASTIARSLDLLSADQYRSFVQDNGLGNQLGSADTDWQDAVTQTGVSQFHNLALSGGIENTSYRASVSYLNQEGVVISSGLERVTGRLNANHKTLDDRLRLDLNLSSSYTMDDFLPYQQTGGFEGAIFTNVFMMNPTFPIRDGNGDYYEIGPGRQSVRNPVALANEIDDFGKTTRTLGNLGAELTLIQGLKAKINVGLDRGQASRRIYFPASSPVGADVNGRAVQRNRERSSATFQSYLTYNNAYARPAHSLEVMGGYEYNEFLTEEFGAEATDFVTDSWTYNNLGGGANLIKPYSFKETSKLVSFFGRTNYNFRNKYYLSGTLRYDGSSRFGPENKWALFPGISAAWRLDKENLLPDVVSSMKLRASWGIIGSQEIGNYNSMAILAPDPGSRAVIGGVPVTGVVPTKFANPNLKWEEKEEFSLGLDYGFLNGKYSGTVEVYRNNTHDLLLDVPVPQPAVVPVRLENIGELQNQGLELSFDALVVDQKEVSIMLGATAGFNRNEVLSLGGRDQIFTGAVSGQGLSDVNAQLITPGQPIGTFFGPVFTGFNDQDQQVFEDYEDTDGDGIGDELVGTTTSPSADDRRILGNAQPDVDYGLRTQVYWGSFDLSAFVRGVQGRDIFNNTAVVYAAKANAGQNKNFFVSGMESPEAITEKPIFSSRWIEDGSFLRLENVVLGYTLPSGMFTSHVRNARVYLSAQNVFVITGYSGYDPEVNTNAGLATLGIDYTNYPKPRTITAGVRLTL